MPSTVFHATVTGAVGTYDSVTVKFAAIVPPLPSVTETLEIDNVGGAGSSLTIVTVVELVPIVAPVAPEIWTLNVSFGSNVVSPFTYTVTVFTVWPGRNVSVPVPPV